MKTNENWKQFEEEITKARYSSLLPYIPMVILAAMGGMITQVVVFNRSLEVIWSSVVPILLALSSTIVFVYWFLFRKEIPQLTIIKSRLKVFSWLLLSAGIITVACDLNFLIHSNGLSSYFLIIQMTLYGICFPFMLTNVGKSAYAYNITLISTTIGYMLIMDVAYALPLSVMILIFELGMLSAMYNRNKSFDSLVVSSVKTHKLAQENEQLANLDSLTGLANRRQFFRSIKTKELDAVIDANIRFTVGIIDLDKFKAINDSYGHRVGDAILIEIANRLVSFNGCINKITFYRLGGDEFAFQKNFDGDNYELIKFGESLIEVIETPISVGDYIFTLTASVGLVTFPDNGKTSEKLYEYADYALYYAKSQGRGSVEVFSPIHLKKLHRKVQIEKALSNSDKAREFFPVFQPIVDLETRRPVAYECLARWESRELGSISPSQFIPIAENLGLISSITLLLFNKAIAIVSSWPKDINLSFNLSANDIINDKVIKDISEAIQINGINPHRVTFELTETALLQDFSTARRNIERLRALGVTLSLDDFGTGCSSLSHVQNLPLNKLKVDKSFVQDIETNPKSRMIVNSILNLCSGIGIDCVIEGVESESQLNLLQSMGAKTVQGFLFSQPILPSEINFDQTYKSKCIEQIPEENIL